MNFCFVTNNVVSSLIFIDLYLTLKNPFKKRSSRVKYYLLIILLNVFVTLLYKKRDNADNMFFVVYSFLTAFPAIVSAILVMKRLTVTGSSEKLKNIVKYRHLTYLLLFLCEFVVLILWLLGSLSNS